MGMGMGMGMGMDSWPGGASMIRNRIKKLEVETRE